MFSVCVSEIEVRSGGKHSVSVLEPCSTYRNVV